MEAVEISVAERVQPSLIATPSADAGALTKPSISCPASSGAGMPCRTPEQAIGWVRGHDLMADRVVWVPAQAVQIDPTDPDRSYWQSSDGLGSGNLMIEAVLHGLAERIERDAGEFWHLRSDQEVADACVDPETLCVRRSLASGFGRRTGRPAPAPLRHHERRRRAHLFRDDIAGCRTAGNRNGVISTSPAAWAAASIPDGLPRPPSARPCRHG